MTFTPANAFAALFLAAFLGLGAYAWRAHRARGHVLDISGQAFLPGVALLVAGNLMLTTNSSDVLGLFGLIVFLAGLVWLWKAARA